MAASSPGSAASGPLRPVAIQDLRAQAQGRVWSVEQHLDDLVSLTPVRGQLGAVHRGAALEVRGEAETIVTLCCDRCLQHYNHPLAFRTRELLWLRQDDEPAAGPVEADDLLLEIDASELELVEGSESLEATGQFDPGRWLFEQLSLQLPLVNRCGPHCPGPDSWGHGSPQVDPRWAALMALQPPQGQAGAQP